jgi:shikimate dehydrogenase
MRTFGLIGKSLSHSFSQQYFNEKFKKEGISDAEYQLFSLENIDDVKTFLKQTTLLGFNVTAPYKMDIIPLVDDLDTVAQEVGAVNCVVKQNHRWVGYNTDVIGFEETMKEIEKHEGAKARRRESTKARKHEGTKARKEYTALVLGLGGAAKAVCYVLKQKNIPFQIVSRKKTDKTITYDEITETLMQQSSIIINTTPLGMFPNIDNQPKIPYSQLNSNHILIDLIYNPDKTLFLKEGKERGALIINGLTMFTTQAEESYLKFTFGVCFDEVNKKQKR